MDSVTPDPFMSGSVKSYTINELWLCPQTSWNPQFTEQRPPVSILVAETRLLLGRNENDIANLLM